MVGVSKKGIYEQMMFELGLKNRNELVIRRSGERSSEANGAIRIASQK